MVHKLTGQEILGAQNCPEWYTTRQESGQESLGAQNGDTEPDRKLLRRALGPKMVQNGQESLGIQNGPEWY